MLSAMEKTWGVGQRGQGLEGFAGGDVQQASPGRLPRQRHLGQDLKG